MSKHTPGEWTYNAALGFIEAQDDILALTFEANAADACLMAAAPDLLAALKSVVAFTGAHGGPYAAARAAIAKAEGTK
jgi:hypothetical protein